MAKKLTVLTAPDPRLLIKAKPITQVTPEIQTLAEDMTHTMYADEGCGLAATQVGVDHRLIIVDVWWTNDTDHQPLVMLNPELVHVSEEMHAQEEGCLSVPEQHVTVSRPARVTLKYMTLEGEHITQDIDGLFATCVQHEIDHLNGKLMIDYLSPLKKTMSLQKLTRWKRHHDNH